jgi:hypothetical protein
MALLLMVITTRAMAVLVMLIVGIAVAIMSVVVTMTRVCRVTVLALSFITVAMRVVMQDSREHANRNIRQD